MRRSNCYLLAAASLIAAIPVTTTWAQESGAVLEEIIVTAEKREENLQKTAIAVTAVDGDALVEAGVSRPEELSNLVPGLNIAQGGPSTQVYVRGVGNYGTNAFADPAVAFNMDGVYISRFSGIAGNFFDVARVEVLKGPQGTLYGRNATGGTINIITNKPGKEFGGGVGVELGNYNLFKANGFINVPVANSFSMRLAAQKTDRDGYQTDGNDDDVSRAVRLGMLFEPSDSFSVLLTGNYLHVGGKGVAEVPKTNAGFYNNSNPWVGQSITMPIALANLPGPPATPPAFLYTGVDYTSGRQDITVKSITADVNADLGVAALTVVANHQNNDNPSKFFGPGFLVDAREKSTQNSIEARLAGETGPTKWTFGLYHFDEKQSSNYWVDQGFLFNQTGMDMDALKDNTNAAFTQLTYSLSDRMRLTGGVRYTQEKKTQDGQIFSKNACPAVAGLTTVTHATVIAAIPQSAVNGQGLAYGGSYCRDSLSGSRKWNDTSWKVGADFDVADDSMVYTTVSRGFKAGGFFSGGDHAMITLPDGTVKVGNAFEPETLTAYAVGSKNRFMNNRLQLNGEAFYWDYKDHQENYLAPTSNLGGFNFVTQRADAEIYGVDLEMDALLSDYDMLGLKLQYLHAEYTDATFINASPGGSSPRSVCAISNLGNPQIWYANCDGQQMPRSPTLSGNLDYSHSFVLSNGGSIVPGANLVYSSSYWSAVDYNPLQKQDAYTMYGADLAYKAPDEAWSITAYGANLGNEVIISNAFMYPGTNSVTNGGAGNIAAVALRAPRTYGVRFSAKF